jgi:hypothetical protein
METYGWSEEFCLDEIDGAKSWVWYYRAVSSRASVWGTGVKIDGLGYVGRERERLKATTKQP